MARNKKANKTKVDLKQVTKTLIGFFLISSFLGNSIKFLTVVIPKMHIMIEEFTAIINPPQAAILAVGATIPVPWVNDKREIVVQDRMTITMSCDHRVVDGMVGARFLETLIQYLEQPLSMLA